MFYALFILPSVLFQVSFQKSL